VSDAGFESSDASSAQASDGSDGSDAETSDAAVSDAVDSATPSCPLTDLLSGLGDFETGISAWRTGATPICNGGGCTLMASSSPLFDTGSARLCGPPTATDSYSLDLNPTFRPASPKSGVYLARAWVRPESGSANLSVLFGVDSLRGTTTRTTGTRSSPVATPLTTSCIEASLTFALPDGGAEFFDPILLARNQVEASCISVDNFSLFYLGNSRAVPPGCGCPAR
jgi:hypothetical protein